ncbi:MAG: CopG family ribbon-helix-helix protein [Verrucomicrobiales bacterium]
MPPIAPNSTAAKPRVERVTVSLPAEVCSDLDALIAGRGFENRSQAVANIITESATDQRLEQGDSVMAGTVTLFYNQKKNDLLTRLAELKREWLDEVIGSLQVQLENDHVMEVIVVQGPGSLLQALTNELLACKGVRAGKLALSSMIMPPVHPLKK